MESRPGSFPESVEDLDRSERLFDEVDRDRKKTSSPELRARVKEDIERGAYAISMNNVQHLQFMEDLPRWANLFHGQYWNVYINKTQESFVTSDNPVVVVSPERKNFYGPTFLQRTHFFALSPEICIQAVEPHRRMGKKLRRITLFPDKEDQVSQLNLTLASQARRYVYARDREPLEGILRYVEAVTNGELK